jgi:hypothetical protein
MEVHAMRWMLAVTTALSYAAMAQDQTIDATTIYGKTLCGYQGWFRCPGDALNIGWVHWSWDTKRIVPETLTFEMWPDMSEYRAAGRYRVDGFTYPDGKPAELYSSDDRGVVFRHFQWMAEYGIHGVWLQRFLVGLPEGPEGPVMYASHKRVLEQVRLAAKATGRTWAVAYDMAAMPPEKIFEAVTNDWKRLVDAGVTNDDRYLHEQGLPVMMVWGFYPKQNITAELANRIIDFFKNDPKYKVFLAGGCEWEWRTETTPGWPEFLRRYDVISPWNVGNYSIDKEGDKYASTHYWQADIEEAKRAGMLYLPVFYPGFSWDNLKRLAPGKSIIERQGGRFFWKQFCAAAELGLDMGYVAMFDEVDEGTAIYKVTSTPPVQAHFVGYEGLPSDWYLRLAGEGTKMLLKQRAFTRELPLRP